jgi:replicative DNA helicase
MTHGPVGNSRDETLADWLGERTEELGTQYNLAAAGLAPVTHCPTGLRRLDAAGVIELGVAHVVLGHEGDGKSALGLQLLKGCAQAGYGCMGFWPEDPRRFISDRVLAPVLGMSATTLRRLKAADPDEMPARLRAAKIEAEGWARRVQVDDRRMESREIVEAIRRRWGKDTRLALVDYAQVLGGEADEGSVERVITRLVWDLNEAAKELGGAIVLLSQVRTLVKERGRRMFDDWKRKNPDKAPTEEAVEGYRPLAGDGQWAPNALGQKARAVLSWFRPRLWLKMHGANVQDDLAELLILKSNYGPSMETLRLKWDGPTTTISDPRA